MSGLEKLVDEMILHNPEIKTSCLSLKNAAAAADNLAYSFCELNSLVSRKLRAPFVLSEHRWQKTTQKKVKHTIKFLSGGCWEQLVKFLFLFQI